MTRVLLAKLFRTERSRFARHWPHVAGASLAIADRHYLARPRCRDVAWVDTDTGQITLLRGVLDLPRANVIALLRHELAHVVDPRASERTADRIASRMGPRISYDAYGIQTIGPGGPRPRGAR